jgi:adenosylhomocysteine/aminodeoxyfutalosine nucleosidase
MSTIAIVAALDRELAPLVRNWQSRWFSHNGQNFRVYELANVAAIAGGIGPSAATDAARAMVARYRPEVLISAGVAGALVQGLKVGTVITPSVIIDSASGTEYRFDAGSGVLVTASQIANGASKQALVKKFQASAVDMEATAVAEIARQERISFRCIKAISDEAGFVMPPLNQFVDQSGKFHTAKFVVWAALRPLRWPEIAALARNTKKAVKALCDHLQGMTSHSLEAQFKEMLQ